jgi:enamine deaminase RidA (YjgF/YER057c/UK114 family)
MTLGGWWGFLLRGFGLRRLLNFGAGHLLAVVARSLLVEGLTSGRQAALCEGAGRTEPLPFVGWSRSFGGCLFLAAAGWWVVAFVRRLWVACRCLVVGWLLSFGDFTFSDSAGSDCSRSPAAGCLAAASPGRFLRSSWARLADLGWAVTMAAMLIERKLAELGLTLPEPIRLPAGVTLPFPWVRVHGNRAFVSGHAPLHTDGSLAGPFGKVGSAVTAEEAYQSARLTGLSVLAGLRRELGDLDRITAWLRVFGMVNTAPGFVTTPAVVNGFSDLILELWGPEAGSHARSAVGVAELPFHIPVEIEAEVALAD